MIYRYIQNKMQIEGSQNFDLNQWAQNTKTPFYLYDLDQLQFRIDEFKKNLHFVKPENIHYAVKANSNPIILKTMAKAGLGADTVSFGEIKRAIECGFSPQRIIFSGVAKTKEELQQSILLQIKQINIESHAELIRIIEITRKLNARNSDSQLKAHIGIRLNPRVAAKTHPNISTGHSNNKFGVDLDELHAVQKSLLESQDAVILKGLNIHIGSNMLELEELNAALDIISEIKDQFLKGPFQIERLDVGGGLGIDYHHYDLKKDSERIQKYAAILLEFHKKNPNSQIMLEPGRILVARSGVLITQVQYIKKNGDYLFAIVDTGMHHLMRPALYDAHHQIWPLQNDTNSPAKTYQVVGPICESTDVIAQKVELKIKQDDYLSIMDCGAYGMSMANEYNLHALPKEYFVSQGEIIHNER